MPSPKRVTVFWLDINTNHGWEDAATAKRAVPSECETTGYLIDDTESHLTVAANWGVDGDGEQINGRTCIPKGCVVRVEELTALSPAA